jgi:hypothetical protein
VVFAREDYGENDAWDRLYVNGRQVDSQTYAGSLANGAGVLRLGFQGHATDYFEGDVAGVAIYDFAFDESPRVRPLPRWLT